MARSSSAYNISRQINEEERYVPKMQLVEGNKKSSAPRELTKLQKVSFFMIVASCACVIAVILSLRVKLTELSGEIENAVIALSNAEIEQEGILTQLNSSDKLQNFETYAKESLGMSKLESYQVKYISANQKDTIKIGDEKPGLLEEAKSVASEIVEYIKG